jgi:DNA-binding transcriptional LysR family regulator
MLNRLSLQQLEILEALLAERSLTHVSARLRLSQPAVSKALAKLRHHFGDPLFVRSAHGMQPTRRAQTLERPLRELLAAARDLAAPSEEFIPSQSHRSFVLCISDAGVAALLPEVVRLLQTEAPWISLQAIQIEPERLRTKLESGEVDLVVGPFPVLPQAIRRRRLWMEGYISVTRPAHPRLNTTPSLAAFRSERHVLVTPEGAHPHQAAERVLLATLPRQQIALREPSFVAAALVVKHTDVVATLPGHIGHMLARELNLQIIRPPLVLPRVPIGLYWHERAHRDEANRWLRSIFIRLFTGDPRGVRHGAPPSVPTARTLT